MPSKITFSESGIMVHNGGKRISLDPSKGTDCDITFVSHAHIDHLHKKRKKSGTSKILTSRATSLIARASGYEFDDISEKYDGFELIDTGHILGSRGLLVDNDVYYTGDISLRERAFMKPAKIPKAKILIIESTFGRPEYKFPKLSEVLHKTNKIISEMYDMGIPVLLMGYPLGKAQLLTKLFSHWGPLYVHDSVYKMNSIYSTLGISLKETTSYSMAEDRHILSKNKPWIMISPLLHSKTNFIRHMKEKYGAVTIGFSGWAVGSRYKYMMGLDHVMPVSDHCDFNELVQVVKRCNPEKVYTFHGFSLDFAKHLQKIGFDSQPVDSIGMEHSHKNKISSLDNYMDV